MKQIIDSHSHIYSSEFDADRVEVIQRAKQSGVAAVIAPNEDSSSMSALEKLCDEEPEFVFPVMGLHPSSVQGSAAKELNAIEKALDRRKCYGIGETGIDLYWNRRYLKEQQEAFEVQLRWSKALNLPIVIHTRDALAEVLECIYKVGTTGLRGVFHCFGGTLNDWQQIAPLTDFFIGIGGVLTFKNSGLREVLPQIPLNRTLVETDAPYLAPTPYRGKRNEPAFITETLKHIAACYQTTEKEAAEVTFFNALKLFNIPVFAMLLQTSDNKHVI